MIVCQAVNSIKWIDDAAVEIIYVQMPYYWLVNINGQTDFCNANAIQGDPHALYQLGSMIINNNLTMLSKDSGVAYIQKSASLGYKHAIKWLERNNCK